MQTHDGLHLSVATHGEADPVERDAATLENLARRWSVLVDGLISSPGHTVVGFYKDSMGHDRVSGLLIRLIRPHL